MCWGLRINCTKDGKEVPEISPPDLKLNILEEVVGLGVIPLFHLELYAHSQWEGLHLLLEPVVGKVDRVLENIHKSVE